MKVDTIEQYRALRFIEENFNMDYITVELLDKYSVGIIDKNDERMIVSFKNNEIKVI